MEREPLNNFPYLINKTDEPKIVEHLEKLRAAGVIGEWSLPTIDKLKGTGRQVLVVRKHGECSPFADFVNFDDGTFVRMSPLNTEGLKGI